MTVDKTLETIDITAPKHVEVLIRYDGKTVWVNVDGICRLRCGNIGNIEVNDQRKKTTVMTSAGVLRRDYSRKNLGRIPRRKV